MAGSNSAGEGQSEMGSAADANQAKRASSAKPAEASEKSAGAARNENNRETKQPETRQPMHDETTVQEQGRKQKQGFLDRSLQARIGTILRESYADIAQEPLPDRLQELIKALQAKEKSSQ